MILRIAGKLLKSGAACITLSCRYGEFDMAANALVQARINSEIKDEATAVLSAMGLTLSDAVRLLLTKVAEERALPFNPLVPNAKTVKAMKDARSGKVKKFKSVHALMADLNEDD